MTQGVTKPRRERTKHELRCFCRGNPLLGMYGVEPNGALYVHVKIYKQARVYGEVYLESGTALIRCRNCLRWNRVTFSRQSSSVVSARLEEATPPPVVADNVPPQ